MGKILGGPVIGGTYVKCSVCKRRRKVAHGGLAWFRRHSRRNVRCWVWELRYEEAPVG
jgi:hypothetical protein